MPARCVAAFCSNTHKDSVSLFKFPKDPELHLKWVKQVRRTRDDWTPSPSSLLCSEHFELDCFDSVLAIKESLGFPVQHKCVLLPGAVPTVFHRVVRPSQASASGLRNADSAERQLQHKCSTSTTVRPCVQKRQKIQVRVENNIYTNEFSDRICWHSYRVWIPPGPRLPVQPVTKVLFYNYTIIPYNILNGSFAYLTVRIQLGMQNSYLECCRKLWCSCKMIP